MKPEILEIIKNRFSDESTITIATDLGLSASKVNYLASKIGVKKSENQVAATRWKTGQKNGVQYQFPKGNIPFNKGKKMSNEVRLKTEKTQFKKGNKPHNTKPIGTINTRYDKTGIPYQYIKISDSNWELYHRHIWEKENGIIPKGYRIHFIDRNTLNCSIDNLQMLNPQDALSRNTIARFPTELISAIQLNKRLIKKIESYGTK